MSTASQPKDTKVEVLLCHCRSFHGPHKPEKHEKLPGGDLDWRTPEERFSERRPEGIR